MTTDALLAHLQTGATHVSRCWGVTRRDGRVLGFTDHDRPLAFDGISFSPQSGLTARAVVSTTGLSINNTEAVGVLSADAITEADIVAGRYDGAEVVIWLVRWDDVAARQVQFCGTIGEITRGAGGFQAELHGLTEALNQPQGRSYLTTCSAVLGDARCGFNVSDPAYTLDYLLQDAPQGSRLALRGIQGFNPAWFDGGQLEILTGAAAGVRTAIKSDVVQGTDRVVTLWSALPTSVRAGDQLRLVAGCDKRAETCREKFSNLLNFQGFPDIPGDDWLVSVPRSDAPNTGGSLSR